VREATPSSRAGACTYAELDDAVKASLGPRWSVIGPFETFDLAGLDVHLAVAEQLFPDLDTSSEPPAELRELVARGDLGCKSGRGLYGGLRRGRGRGAARAACRRAHRAAGASQPLDTGARARRVDRVLDPRNPNAGRDALR